MSPKEVFHNTAYSVQLTYTAGHSLYRVLGQGHKFFENQCKRCEIIYFVKRSFLIKRELIF